MSVGELNQLMTYVIEGWMLFSAGFTSIAFVSFVARRVQEDAEAAELTQLEGQTESIVESKAVTVTETVEMAVAQTAAKPKAQTPKPKKSEPKQSNPEAPPAQNTDESLGEETIVDEEKEKARLEEVAAVSEKLAKAKEKQSSASSVSVSTRPQ